MYTVQSCYIVYNQTVNTCTYCNVCIKHIFHKASLIALNHNNMLYNNLNILKNVAWKFRLLFKNYIDLCIATTYYTRNLMRNA